MNEKNNMSKENAYQVKPPRFGNLFYRKENIAYTHSGTFHADDVCSAALLEIVFPGIEIKRVSYVPEDAELAFDIGGGVFDHHQSNAKLRENGDKYAAFGLLWKEIGPMLFSPEHVKLFDDVFVKAIDYTDNTGFPNPFSSAIKAFNPSWNDTSTTSEQFQKAVDFAKIAILNQFNRYNSTTLSGSVMEDIVNDKENFITEHILFLDTYMPYHKACVPRDIYYVIFPSNRTEGSWTITSVATVVGGKVPKLPFPEEWKMSPPHGLTYLRAENPLAVFDSREATTNAAQKLEKHIEKFEERTVH